MRSINPKKKHKPNNKIIKFVLAVVALAVVLALAYGGYKYYRSAQPTQKPTAGATSHVNYGPPSPAQTQYSDSVKQQLAQNSVQSGGNSNSNTTPPSSPSNSISVIISRANQVSAGQPLNIRTVINGTTSGQCAVTLTKSGQPTIVKTFPVAFQATYATCQQSDIPIADFSISGTWQLSVTVQTSSATSSPAVSNVTVAK